MDGNWDYVIVGAGASGAALAHALATGTTSRILVLALTSAVSAPGPAVRPHVLEFDAWARPGVRGWAPEQVLPHFKRIESDASLSELHYHGATGPVQLARTPDARWSDLDRGFRAAAMEMGHPWAPDHNAPGVLGVSPQTWTANEQGPVDAVATLMGCVRELEQVTVDAVDAVDRVLWDGCRAVGLRVQRAGRWHELAAENIILCAGGLETPLILQRSGVGPTSHLREAGVDTVLDLPVGQGVQVHPQLRILTSEPATEPFDEARYGMLARWNTGLEGTASGDLMAWTSNAASPDPAGVVGALAQVFSRGSLAITGADPLSPARLDTGMLSDSLDGYRFRLLYRHLSDLCLRPGLAAAFASSRDRHGDRWDFNREPQELQEWLQAVMEPGGGYAAGCRLGAVGDPRAVVDEGGRVIGAQGVRVADLSMVPALVRAAPMLTEFALGSRMAQLMVAERNCRETLGKGFD